MKKTLSLTFVVLILTGTILACGGAADLPSGTRPSMYLPDLYFQRHGDLSFVDYLPVGKIYDSGPVFFFISAYTETTADITICFKENLKLYGPTIGCSTRTHALDPKDSTSTEYWPIAPQFVIQMNGTHEGLPNVETFNLDGSKNVVAVSPEEMFAALGITVTPTPVSSNAIAMDPLPTRDEAGLLAMPHSELKDGELYIIGELPIFELAQYHKDTDTMSILAWEEATLSYTTLVEIRRTDDLLIFDRLNEVEIVIGTQYSVCSLPGLTVYLEDGNPEVPDLILRGCFIGEYMGHAQNGMFYWFKSLEGQDFLLDYMPAAYTLVRPTSVLVLK